MSKFSRDKGKRVERALAIELRTAFPKYKDLIKRGSQTHKLGGSQNQADVYGVPGYWLESKGLARFNTSPLDQAVKDAKGRGIPIAIIRANHKKPVAMMLWSDLLTLMVYYEARHGRQDRVLRQRRPGQVLPRRRIWRLRPSTRGN